MGSEARIPTLLGLGVLTAGLVAGIFLVTTNQILKSSASQGAAPQDVTLSNVSSDHVSISWQTDQPTAGFIQAGLTTSLGNTYLDDRDTRAPGQHRLHFVTLNNLTPNTTYHYKISSGPENYPKSETFVFKTAPEIDPSNLQPIIGSIIGVSGQPVSEAIATLDIPGAQPLSAVTKVAGNFVLPLSTIYNRELSGGFSITEATLSATLTVSDAERKSQITFQIPRQDFVFPLITLGQDLNLDSQPASPSASTPPYDLNSDGVINSLDQSTVLQNWGKNPKNKAADLNGDKVVDQKDLDFLQKYMPGTNQ